MPFNLAQKLIHAHLLDGELCADAQIALKIDQPLLQDVLGVLVMLELEAFGLDRIKVSLAAPCAARKPPRHRR